MIFKNTQGGFIGSVDQLFPILLNRNHKGKMRMNCSMVKESIVLYIKVMWVLKYEDRSQGVWVKLVPSPKKQKILARRENWEELFVSSHSVGLFGQNGACDPPCHWSIILGMGPVHPDQWNGPEKKYTYLHEATK